MFNSVLPIAMVLSCSIDGISNKIKKKLPVKKSKGIFGGFDGSCLTSANDLAAWEAKDRTWR
jgi:hypothetical protein